MRCDVQIRGFYSSEVSWIVGLTAEGGCRRMVEHCCVYDEIVSERAELLDAGLKVGGGVRGGLLVEGEVHTDHARVAVCSEGCQSIGHGVGTLIAEADSVDHAPVLLEAEYPRFGGALLRLGSDAPHLGEFK